MAAARERRGNAGSKMAKLLNEEEEDDFYKTTYGGFEEVEDDKVMICLLRSQLRGLSRPGQGIWRLERYPKTKVSDVAQSGPGLSSML